MTRGSIDRRAVFAGTVPPVTRGDGAGRGRCASPAVPEASERTGTVWYSPALGVRPLDARSPSHRLHRHQPWATTATLAMFVLMVLESACIPIPSEVTMLFGGALASAGFAAPGQRTLAVLGGHGGHARQPGRFVAGVLGRRLRRTSAGRPVRSIPVDPPPRGRQGPRLVRAVRGAAVFFSRLLPVIRTFISLPAGVVRMPFWRFTLYTVLGCLPWTFALAWFGYALGDRWESVERALQPFSWAIAAAVRGGGRGLSSDVVGPRCGPNTRRSTPRGRHRAGRVHPEARLTYRLTSIVQLSPCSPTFSKPTRWYIIRDRLCTATDSDRVR